MSSKIRNIARPPQLDANPKLEQAYKKLQTLISELQQRQLPNDVVNTINAEIEHTNTLPGTTKEQQKQMDSSRRKLLQELREKLKIVPKNYYRKLWLALGISIFGIPLGVALGSALGNMAFIGVGLCMGLPIGIAVGAGLDKKAADEGRQLDYEETP